MALIIFSFICIGWGVWVINTTKDKGLIILNAAVVVQSMDLIIKEFIK